MRRLLALSFVVLTTAPAIASQVLPRPTGIEIARVGERASAGGNLNEEMYIGRGGIVEVPQPLSPETRVTASGFYVRAWKEGDKARVMVTAIVGAARGPKKEIETPISTFKLALGESREVTEAAAWGAQSIVITAVVLPSRR